MDKKTYESIKALLYKVVSGQPTTFAERNWLNINLKQQARKKKRVLTK